MKKTLLLAGLAIAAILASCNKIETREQDNCTLPKVNITVNGLPGDGATKSAKTGWVAGDQIYIWFDLGPNKYDPVDYNPEMILTYDGSKWNAEYQDQFNKSKLNANGTISAVYSNDHTVFFGRNHVFSAHFRYPCSKVESGPITPMTVQTSVSYIYNSENNVITANLSGWKYLTKIQFLVTGLTVPGHYLLNASVDDESYAGLYSLGGIQLYDATVMPYGNLSYSSGAAGSFATPEGVYFFFYDTTKPGVPANYHLTLNALEFGSWTWYEYTANGKTIDTSDDKIVSIKIDRSKFPGL